MDFLTSVHAPWCFYAFADARAYACGLSWEVGDAGLRLRAFVGTHP